MIRPSISGVLATGALLLGATLSAPMTLDIATASSTDRAAGPVKFQIIDTNTNEKDGGSIAATGAIHAMGHDKLAGNRKDLFEFPGGTLVIQHKPKKGSAHDSYDPATCLFTFTERGTWKVGDGSTGAYAGATGSGTYKVIGQGFGCDENTPPDPFYTKVTAKGSLS